MQSATPTAIGFEMPISDNDYSDFGCIFAFHNIYLK
jgi:hypothetical protein